MSTYITVAIPYVNSVPHLGYAYELVEADLAARARRALGERVRFLGGTDDHSLKNVFAAEAAGEPVGDFVGRHGDRFAALADSLAISFDDFIRTSTDPRHTPAVERLWSACAQNGDLYRREYEGWYCVGCEQFYDPDELDDGVCAEHRTRVDTVTETNWFFRLSRYQDDLERLIVNETLLIDPPQFRNEILEFVRTGLRDVSVSRSVHRARGWGIPVPDDPTQVIYVWFDALTNYLSALDYGTDGSAYAIWWRNADERIHVVGKGITRFHAVYWPAFLLSAGEPLPTRIHIHPYLTIESAKISKSSGNGHAPDELADRYGRDAIRWWAARDVSPTTDTDFTIDRLVGVANDDLANGLGNAVSRVITLAHRHEVDLTPPYSCEPLAGSHDVATLVARALADFDRRTATDLLRRAIDELNRDIETTQPWALAREPGSRDELEHLLTTYAATIRSIARAIQPITPDLAERIEQYIDAPSTRRPEPTFSRLDP